MADESYEEKTEQPTARRLEKAHEEGQVAKSPEFITSVMLLGTLASIGAFGAPLLGRTAAEQLRQASSWLVLGPLDADTAALLLRDTGRHLLLALIPVLAAIALPALVLGGLQAGGVLSGKPAAPDFSRVSPLKGFGRLFSVDALVTLLKSVVKVTALGLVTWLALRGQWDQLAALPGATAGAVTTATIALVSRVVWWTGLAFLAIAGADFAWQRSEHNKRLRMSRQEIAQEHKEMEGDPLQRSRRRSIALDMARKRMLHRVPEADVVLVNPTAIAVAIKYDPAEAGAPIILAMGRRKLAEKIREVAREAGVPIVQNIPVARALIKNGKVGRMIPAALYAAVAEVLAFVYRRRGQLPALARGGRP